MTKLHLASGLELPVDVVTQKLAFLGRTGSGKTYAATKLAELMLGAGGQIVALDPVGKWYGLRVGADGKKGFEIPVFGGLHGDIPLEAAAGALMADLIVDRGISAVLDVSQWEHETDKARFARDFAARFFFRKKAAPTAVHLFLEECQEFVPQNPGPRETDMLHAFTRMAKLGRNFGIGISLISQRPQEVNKKVLNMTEVMCAFQMRGPQERKTIKDWSADKDVSIDIVDQLPKLPEGDCFISSPQWLGIEQRVHIAKKRTADVSATPEVGASSTPAQPLTPIDLAQLQKTMAATIEKAKAEDPKELRKEIAKLRSELARAGKQIVSQPKASAPDPAALQKQIDRAVTAAIVAERKRLDADYRAMSQALAGARRALSAALKAAGEFDSAIASIDMAAEKLNAPKDSPTPEVRPVVRASRTAATLAPGNASVASVRPAPRITSIASTNGNLPKGERRILEALAELKAMGTSPAPRAAVGVMAGYNLSGGSPAQYVGALVDRGYVQIPTQGQLELTAAGDQETANVEPPRSLDELHNRAFARLTAGERKILEHLISFYPEEVSRAAVGAAVGYNLSGGSPAQYVGKLVTLDFAEIPRAGVLRASDLLFPPGLG